MESRGRKSAAALAIVGPSGIETVRRPLAPSDLTDEQADEWRAIVNRLAADWFPRETHGLLAQYCRHIVAARRIADMIAELEQGPLDLDQYDTLLRMQEREGRALSSLATRMRISQQSSYDEKKKKPLQGKRPWDAGRS